MATSTKVEAEAKSHKHRLNTTVWPLFELQGQIPHNIIGLSPYVWDAL